MNSLGKRKEMEDLAAYFYQNTFLAYHQYVQVKNDRLMGEDKDLREAINAAVALYHFREHIPPPFQKSRAQLAVQCPDYDLLGDIVNAAKHNVLTHGTPQVVRADSIYQIMVCTKYKDQHGEYDHCKKVVEVKLVDGSTRDVYEVLTNVINMWFDELHQIGAIDQRLPIQLQKQDIVTRENASNVDLQITQGIQWKQHMRFQQYNYETNEIEAVDLSDAENIVFTVRKPQTFELQLGDDSGLKATKQVQLTREQAGKLEQIEDANQRSQYLWEVAVSQGIVDQMIAEYQSTLKDGEG